MLPPFFVEVLREMPQSGCDLTVVAVAAIHAIAVPEQGAEYFAGPVLLSTA